MAGYQSISLWREVVLEAELLASDGTWSWRMEYRRRWQVLREMCNDIQDHRHFTNVFLALIYINTVRPGIYYPATSS